MAYSEVVSNMKQEAIKQLISNDLFIKTLDAKVDKEDLVGNNIFTYSMNPEIIKEPCTFVNLSVQIPRVYGDKQNMHPLLEVRVVSHVDKMKIDPKQIKTQANRIDFMSQVVDHILNDTDNSTKKFGFFGQLETIRNEEGVYNKDWLYRYLAFETFDFNQGYSPEKKKKFFEKYGCTLNDKGEWKLNG